MNQSRVLGHVAEEVDCEHSEASSASRVASGLEATRSDYHVNRLMGDCNEVSDAKRRAGSAGT